MFSSRYFRDSAYPLFITVIIIWGINWPIMKFGLNYISPLWFASIRVLTGAACLFLFLLFKRQLHLPKINDLPIIITIGCLQIGVSIALINIALTHTDAGHSSILAYTTPIWVAPLAAIFLGEKFNSCSLLGLTLGSCGILILLQLNTLQFSWGSNLIASCLLLLAAIFWAIAIVHVRAHMWEARPIQLMPIQMTLGGILIIPFALALEGAPNFSWSLNLGAVLIYNGPVASAFCFWAYITVARELPATTTAMGSLGVPMVGFLSSTIFLNETVTANKILGLTFISLGIIFVTVIDHKKFSNFFSSNAGKLIGLISRLKQKPSSTE